MAKKVCVGIGFHRVPATVTVNRTTATADEIIQSIESKTDSVNLAELPPHRRIQARLKLAKQKRQAPKVLQQQSPTLNFVPSVDFAVQQQRQETPLFGPPSTPASQSMLAEPKSATPASRQGTPKQYTSTARLILETLDQHISPAAVCALYYVLFFINMLDYRRLIGIHCKNKNNKYLH